MEKGKINSFSPQFAFDPTKEYDPANLNDRLEMQSMVYQAALLMFLSLVLTQFGSFKRISWDNNHGKMIF